MPTPPVNVAIGERTLFPATPDTALALDPFPGDGMDRVLVRLADPAASRAEQWTRTRDLRTGHPVEVRAAACGLGCRCAGEVRVLAPGYDHDPVPDDLPEPGDRCKTCGEPITWLGPSTVTDWMHVNDERNR